MLFAITELLIGTFGLISKSLYYDVLYVGFPELAASRVTAAVVLFCALLWPTFVIGLSMPLLSRALSSSLDGVARVVGSLYGWNTLGAATGAFVGTWVLLPRLGLERSLWTAAALNLTCAAVAAVLRPRASAIVTDERAARYGELHHRMPCPTEVLPFRVWALIYGVTGFIALALEITWFRLLGVILKSTAFTFGTLLWVYLSGLGLGAAVAARHVTRSRRPGEIISSYCDGTSSPAALP